MRASQWKGRSDEDHLDHQDPEDRVNEDTRGVLRVLHERPVTSGCSLSGTLSGAASVLGLSGMEAGSPIAANFAMTSTTPVI